MSRAGSVAASLTAAAAPGGAYRAAAPAGAFRAGRARLARLGLLLTLAAGLLAAGPARALSPEEIERRVQIVTDDLRCPTCQAISVKDSEAAFSVEIRDKVQRMVVEGQSDDDIKAYFVSRYGEWILRSPRKAGLGLLVWLLPFAAILAGGAALVVAILRHGRGTGAAPAAPSLTPEQRERVREDLKRFEEED
jgi:cytochrome c-type biogenesis protein CcmH